MYGYMIKFDSIPKAGFALHCKIHNYNKKFTPEQQGFEVVYVKKETITLEYDNNKWEAKPGSILFLQRNLPFILYTKNNEMSEHSSVQLLTDFDVTLSKDLDTDYINNKQALALPFILYPSESNEAIMKKMNTIISGIGESSFGEDMNEGILLTSILYDISQAWKYQQKEKSKTSSVLSYKVKKIISKYTDMNITLEYLSSQLGKTPNYLNYVFKKETGMTIHSYITKEKVRIIGELILDKGLAFNDACNTVGISDISYGYRLFKKHTGLTPKEFSKGLIFEKH